MSLPEKVREVLAAVLEASGESDSRLRRAVLARARAAAGLGAAEGTLPPHLDAYVEKLAERPASVTERDLDALRAAGLGDEQIFELSLAAAMGASLCRFEHGLALVRR